MLGQFVQNIEKKALFSTGQKVLVAVSGGIDSMVLLNLFEQSGFEYGLIHCNFHLRGDESDGDEQFVREVAGEHGIPAFFTDFDTEEYARLSGISIEMAARKLRYDYFEEIRRQYSYDRIATAHHRDDLIETFFLNLSRKTGIRGLTGIKEKSGNIIRPLLFAGREEIEQYAAKHYLEYREDSSNDEVIYQRNFIRHKILPLFAELNPAFRKNFLTSISHLREAEQIYDHFLDKQRKKVVKTEEQQVLIQIEKLQASAFPKVLLLEILSPYNFNPSVVDDVYKSLGNTSGKQFFSRTHRVVKDREYLYVSEAREEEDKLYYIEKDDMELFDPFDITIEKPDANDFRIIRDKNVACIDLEKIDFPLLIRKWKQGDYFQPLGMRGMKKVSDYFIDEKVPLHEKENTWLLCSGKKIVWIMGQRLDDRFKITPKSRQVLLIQIK